MEVSLLVGPSTIKTLDILSLLDFLDGSEWRLKESVILKDRRTNQGLLIIPCFSSYYEEQNFHLIILQHCTVIVLTSSFITLFYSIKKFGQYWLYPTNVKVSFYHYNFINNLK